MESVAEAELLSKKEGNDHQHQHNRSSSWFISPFSSWWSGHRYYLKVKDTEEQDHQSSLDLDDDEDVNNYLASYRERYSRRKNWATRAKALVVGVAALIALIIIGILSFAAVKPSATTHGTEGHNHQNNHDRPPSSSNSVHNHHHSHDDTPPPHPSHNEPAQCGASPDEARQRGCIFDPPLTAWVPPACAFRDVMDEFQDAVGDMMTEWPWFWDLDVSHPVEAAAIPALQAGNYSVIYTTYRPSHALHCLYCWRKVSYALEHGLDMMDTRCHQFYHERHCAYFIADRLMESEAGGDREMEKWAYPLLYHNCVPLTSTLES